MLLPIPAPDGCGRARGAEGKSAPRTARLPRTPSSAQGGSKLRAWALRFLPTAAGRGSQVPRTHFHRTPLPPPSHVLSCGALASELPSAARACPGCREENQAEDKGSPGSFGTPPPGLSHASRFPERSPHHALRPALSLSRCERPSPESPSVPVWRPCVRPPAPQALGVAARLRPGPPAAFAGAPTGFSYPGRQGALRPGSCRARRAGRPGSPLPLPAAGRCGSLRALARSAVVTARAAPPLPIDMLLTSACTRRGPAPPGRSPPAPRGPRPGDPRRGSALPLHPGRPVGWRRGGRGGEVGAKGTRVGDGFQLARPWRSLGWRGWLRAPRSPRGNAEGSPPAPFSPATPHPPPPPTSFRSLRVRGLAGGGVGGRRRRAGRREPICFRGYG